VWNLSDELAKGQPGELAQLEAFGALVGEE
jgi:hypothetical protein